MQSCLHSIRSHPCGLFYLLELLSACLDRLPVRMIVQAKEQNLHRKWVDFLPKEISWDKLSIAGTHEIATRARLWWTDDPLPEDHCQHEKTHLGSSPHWRLNRPHRLAYPAFSELEYCSRMITSNPAKAPLRLHGCLQLEADMFDKQSRAESYAVRCGFGECWGSGGDGGRQLGWRKHRSRTG